MNEFRSAVGMNPSWGILRTEWGAGEGMELRIGTGWMDSGLWEGADTGTGTGVRVPRGFGAWVTGGMDTGVAAVRTGKVGAR
jgi:hypothetical protein